MGSPIAARHNIGCPRISNILLMIAESHWSEEATRSNAPNATCRMTHTEVKNVTSALHCDSIHGNGIDRTPKGVGPNVLPRNRTEERNQCSILNVVQTPRKENNIQDGTLVSFLG